MAGEEMAQRRERERGRDAVMMIMQQSVLPLMPAAMLRPRFLRPRATL